MKFTVSAVIAASAFLPAISAHLIMVEPKQWYVPEIIRATVATSDSQQHPLQADGSNYPCQGVAPEASVATYEPGSMQNLGLIGTAVHSGGSGQMSITYDTTPTKESKFRVMDSWEGGHPIRVDGNLLPADASYVLPIIQFKVPENLPAGKAVVAWTWFNKSGNREMYMKCATVTIGGSETSTAAFEALPEMFRANSGNGCEVPEDVDAIKFKNPGPYVVGTGTTTIDCDNTQAGTGSGSSSGSGSGSGSSSTALSPSSTSAPVYQAPATSSTPTPTEIPTPAYTTAPVVAVPPPSSTAVCQEGLITCNADGTWALCGSGITHQMGASPAGMTCENGGFIRTGTSGSGSSSTPSPSSTSAPAYKAQGTSTTPVVTVPSPTSTAVCQEGLITCNADGTWALCGSGITHQMGASPAGMTCSNGGFHRTTASKRSIRFSHDHMRRNHHN
ncbi:hypothetical protein RUND412_002122 [Rhizina undulata]